ncbi:proteasome subunit beta [Candidatus Woesearchaeota archaeon]|nr:proteasome subunit beta [Candidatus Woesearchaeota archaeon]
MPPQKEFFSRLKMGKGEHTMEATTLKTGTTTVGIVCKDCIILAADKRATAGNLIVDKKSKKVVPINDRIAVTTAGSVSELQLLIKYLKAELKLKEFRTNRPSTINEAANLLGGMVYGAIRSSFTMPAIAHFLIAGADNGSTQLYDLFPDGSITTITDFVATGSGSVFAYGVLENNYKDSLTEEEGVELAVKTINASLQRDTGSGQGIDVYVIDKQGAREAYHQLLDTKLAK